MSDLRREELEFLVFCIENIGQELGITGDKVYRLLTKNSRILKDYMIPNYEILHTQSKEYIVADIIEYMQAEGVLK